MTRPIRPSSLNRRQTSRYQDATPGIVAYLIVICGVAWLAGESTFGENWFRAGSVDGELIRAGRVVARRHGTNAAFGTPSPGGQPLFSVPCSACSPAAYSAPVSPGSRSSSRPWPATC